MENIFQTITQTVGVIMIPAIVAGIQILKIKTNHTINREKVKLEQDKLELEKAKLQLERDKFEYNRKEDKKEK